MRSKAQDWAKPGNAPTRVQFVGNNTNCIHNEDDTSKKTEERAAKHGLMDDYAPPSEAARELRKHPFTLKRWRRAGYGPQPVKIGGRLYYRRSDLARWLESLGDSEASA